MSMISNFVQALLRSLHRNVHSSYTKIDLK